MQRCSLWMVLRFLLSAVREPKQRWQFLATKCQVNRFICSLFQISWSSANIENDQCISSLEYFTDDIKPIIDLILKWSQQRDVFIIFSPKSSYVLSWMNAGHRRKDEFPYEGAAQEINRLQVSVLFCGCWPISHLRNSSYQRHSWFPSIYYD